MQSLRSLRPNDRLRPAGAASKPSAAAVTSSFSALSHDVGCALHPSSTTRNGQSLRCLIAHEGTVQPAFLSIICLRLARAIKLLKLPSCPELAGHERAHLLAACF